ncbi:MAG: sugar transferase, partial [Desulfobacula sp.]|nr:sugar transferase [Desulfobacula sp.]
FYHIKKGSSNNNFIKHLLLVGTGFNAQSISDYIENHPECGLRLTGFLTNQDDEIGKMISNKKILGKAGNLNTIVSEYYTDCVLYAGDNGYTNYHESIIKSCRIMGIDFATTELELHNEAINNKHIFSEHIGNIELKVIKFVYISPQASFLKRVFDFIVSSIIIVLFLPIWVVIPIVIKLTSPGPVFFRQERIGKYGKKFILFKFRSMVVDAENMQESLIYLNEMDGPAFKIKNDPRLTSAGKFLRKTSLDELPQLFNVIKGDISLVGPRPAIENEVIHYRPQERKRLSLMQGITCIWQVSGRNKIKFDEWMKLDLMYVDTWSTAQDLKILFKTIPAVLLKKGAR